jgi:hypothetical protein
MRDQHEAHEAGAGHAGAGVQIRGSVCTGRDDVNGGAVDPPAPDPPLCMTDHPPAYYALIHSRKYPSIQTPPFIRQSTPPGGIYFSERYCSHGNNRLHSHQ